MDMTRRKFIGLTAAAGAGAVAVSLPGCSLLGKGKDGEIVEKTGLKIPSKVDEKLSCDIVVVGGGISGLAASVQAALDGYNVITLEKTSVLGPMGGSVEGQFGVETKMQKAAGIDFTIADVVAHEMEIAQFRNPGAQWIDLCTQSSDNIDWEIEQGVEFEYVDDYFGTCTLPTFHWFKNHKASAGYIEPMGKRARELGAEIMLKTAATAMILQDGKIQGVYAENSDGTVYSIDAKAVILASGGVGGDRELVAEQGWTSEHVLLGGNAGSNGDGLRMALSAGGKDILPETCAFVMNYIPALPSMNIPQYADPLNGMVTGVASAHGFGLWVNQDGQRFVNENIGARNMMYQTMPTKANKYSYVIFNQALFDKTFGPLVDDAARILEESLATNDGDSLFRADSLAELAQAVGMDADALKASVERYNAMCAKGSDTDFSREAETLEALSSGPYYIARIEQTYFGSIGGILCNARQEVLTPGKDPIPGLYAAGLDGAMLYRNVYTINLGGSCCANNVNTGRHSAMNAGAYIKSV